MAVRNVVSQRYPNDTLLKTEYQYDDFGICKSVILSLKGNEVVRQEVLNLDEIGVIHKSTEVFDVLAQNGVRYLLYDMSLQRYVDQLAQECESLGIPYYMGVLSAECKYIELFHTVPVLVNQEFEYISFSSGMDWLRIPVSQQDQVYHMAMTYDEHLKAVFYSEDGKTIRNVGLCGDAKGNLVIDLGDHGNGTLKIQYQNPLNTCTLICMLALVFAITLTVFGTLRRRGGNESAETISDF